MKKILLVGMAVGLMCWLGCGGDDPVSPPVTTVITVTADTSSTAPARDSVDDPIWTRIASKNVPVVASQFSSANKSRPSSALAVDDGVGVQAVVVGGTDLYLRLTWDDATWDCWPGKLEVTSFFDVTWAQFTRRGEVEDQLMVMFDGGTLGWDVWHWRVATTGAGYLAEGTVLDGTTLTVDPGDDDLAVLNQDVGVSQPNFMHPEGPVNQSHQLLEADADTMVVHPDSLTARYGTIWALGDLVPGYVYDGLKYLEIPSARGDRWDVGAISEWTSGTYALVLHRALNTGNGETDLDLSGLTTVDVRIGITNNGDFSFTSGSSEQGFSNTFKLVLQ